jgi:peroxiredoxin Q/BCP
VNKELKIGDPAPPFDLPTAGGGRVNLKSFRGKRLVLYFYPKDDTPGCTQEALDFSAATDAFAAANTAIVGVSRDPPSKHEKFAAKHGLTVTLASDEDGKTCVDYGVWVEKKLYGRASMGVERATFLVNEKGRISRLWRKVKVTGHVEDVKKALEQL